MKNDNICTFNQINNTANNRDNKLADYLPIYNS